jgi:hypothetical protein
LGAYRAPTDDAAVTPPRAEHYGIDENLAQSVRPQVHWAFLYWGVAPEFDISVEAQGAHSGIFDLIVECGGDDSLLVPIDKKDKKHGDSVGIYYTPITNIFWAVSYLLRNTSFRNTHQDCGYQNARAKMELISIDAVIAHHPVVGNRMMNPGPRPAGTPYANWPPPFDEVHTAASQRGGLGNLGLLLRWDMAASAPSAVAATAIASAAIPTAVTTPISTASSDTGAASSSNTPANINVRCTLTLDVQ